MAEATLIPNSFQHPNAYVDWLSYYLTPQEEKVLNKAIREIIGWRDKIESRKARIALSIFVDGKYKDGVLVAMGCGLSKDAVRKALLVLHQFNILVKVGTLNNDGQEYQLIDDWDAIKWDALKMRRRAWDDANNQRTSAAREALAEQGGIVGQYARGVLSDSNKETQDSLETQDTAPKEARMPTPPIPEPTYEDLDEDGYPDSSSPLKKPKWQIPDTEEQKEFLATCNAKWFESKQKRKVKAILSAVTAGNIAGLNVYGRVLADIEDKTELIDVPRLLPQDWYEKRLTEAKEHSWSRWGLIRALMDRDKLAEHCQHKLRELSKGSPSARFRPVDESPPEVEIGPVRILDTFTDSDGRVFRHVDTLG